ncbi:putative baseplate assembly protein [Nitrosomonas sp. Nm51]|uniref:baseplate J/gp47 family protein n=1 Tax=Nitrosomonas sp. Nm51 TaxID=133720 RepID=UPI0008B940F9|nr:baseplate J/gp47 family protein [Nitrosomonas sp. Nm51]SER47223.1 putative baseplate assembly protein [Nitrosomonas sp. Nm51]
MSMQSPNLDDRTFTDLVEAAKLRIRQRCPEWSDLSPGDPGIVLLEAFAFLTETMIFRLNRIPEKAYIEFLKMIGVRLTPPCAAQVTLEFSLSKPQSKAVEIPVNTRVATANSASGTDAPVFTSSEAATIPAGETSVQVPAYHCNQIDAELIGVGSGLPGLTLSVKHAPVIYPTSGKLDLIVGVETPAETLEAHATAVRHLDKSYRIWTEVENFSDCSNNPFVYVADRHAGTITFAPAVHRQDDSSGLMQTAPEALAEIPPAGLEIRVWYKYGGGSTGNVSAHALTVLKDPIAGVSVTNPVPATGGRAQESLQNALIRGPQELHSLSRAVTARDFELIATQSSGAVNRAKAFTQAQLWAHATPGTVEVTLVPEVSASANQLHSITADTLQSHHVESVRKQIQTVLESRKPLGTHCVVNWINYKRVSIKAKITIHREEQAEQVKQRVLNELYNGICPIKLPNGSKTPWPFGQSLKAWDVYKIIGSEPAVLSVDTMQMIVDDVPDTKVLDLCADAFQQDAWYSGCDERVFRSTNNGSSWEMIARFDGEEVERIQSFPVESCHSVRHAGLLAVTTKISSHISSVKISKDCGQTWIAAQQFQFSIDDIAWVDRDGFPYILLASEKGLYELSLQKKAVPVQILVDAKLPEHGFRAVTVSSALGGRTFVAAAGYENKGVYLSFEGGKSGSFQNIGLTGELIEVLSVQHKGPHRYLWAGIAAPGSDQGKGCFRWTLSESAVNPEGWKAYSRNWTAGGCRSLAFQGSIVLAASYRLGVLRLNSDLHNPEWETLNASECGLPLRDVGKLETIDAVASAANASVIMAGGVLGVYRSLDSGLHYAKCSQHVFSDEVRIPPNWLFYSGMHEIEISS